MIKVCFVVDVEGLISFAQKNPEWTFAQNVKKKIALLLQYFLYDKEGYDKIYNMVCKYKMPVSFMLVGSVFKPKKNISFIDYGYHSYTHKPLTYCADEEVIKEIKNIYNAASFSAPMNLVDDPLKPHRILKMLGKEGYKIVIWGGPTIRDKKGRIIVVPPRKKISKPEIIEGIKCMYISNFFNGKTSRIKIDEMMREIEKNRGKNAVYCITTHDFSDKSMKNVEYVIKKLLELQQDKKIKIVNLRQLAK